MSKEQEDEILKEARWQREHEAKLAKIQADKEVEIEKVRSDDRDNRRIFIVVVSGILFIFLLLVSFVGCSVLSSKDCAQSGGAWDAVNTRCEMPGVGDE